MMRIKNFRNKLSNNSLALNSIIVFAGTMVTNVGAYLYHLLMGRMLGPSGYGELSSLLSIFYIFNVPLLVGQTVLVKFISGFKAEGKIGQAKSLFLLVTKIFLIIAVLGLPAAFISDGWVVAFLHLSRPLLFLLIYLLFAFSLLSIVIVSTLQGYQKFIWMVLVGVGGIGLKLLISIPFVAWGVYGVLWAAVLASIGIYMTSFIPLRFLFQVVSKPVTLSKKRVFSYFIPTFLTLLGITSLYSTDIILVRHFFSGETAGLYAALGILGKIIFYASSAIGIVLFPVLSERFAKKNSTNKLIISSLGVVSFISMGITLVYFLFPDFIVQALFGKAYTGAGALLGLFGIFITLFSIGNILSLACLAIENTGVWVAPFVCALLQIVGITLFHENIRTVILINIFICSLFVLGSGGYFLWKERLHA